MAGPGTFSRGGDFSGTAYAYASARRRSAAQGLGYLPRIPGPTPFRAGSVTPAAALTKAVHAFVAARANRDMADSYNRAALALQARDEEYRALQEENLRSQVDPELRSARITADERAREAAKPVAEEDQPIEVDKRLVPFVGPGKRSMKFQREAKGLYGIKDEEQTYHIPGYSQPVSKSVYEDWQKDQLRSKGLIHGGREEKFDPITESDRSAEQAAVKNYDTALAAAKAKYVSDHAADNGGSGLSPNALLALQSFPPKEITDSLKGLSDAVAQTRARRLSGALGRANNYDDIVQGLSGFAVNDPASAPELAGPARKAALLKGYRMATSKQQIDQLGVFTQSPTDPLHADPDIQAALTDAYSRYPQ